jgi:hypothetical protein
MTEEQRGLLDRRIRAAAEQQPEIQILRTMLLEIGGVELVAPPTFDPDVPILIKHGSVMNATVVCNILDEGRCHENVSELWLDEEKSLTGIGIGYALSADGLWRQHSWGVRQNEIVETTEERQKYFGRLLQGPDAGMFAETNRGDPEERRWRRLPEVYFRLQKDADGYPPKDWEGLKAEPTDEPQTYRIKSVPFYARQVAYEDEVRTCTSVEGFSPVFETVSKRSGFSTMRLLIEETEDRAALTEYFTKRDCLLEFKGRLVSIGIPKAAFDEVSDYIGSEKERGHWDAEDGHLAIDD